MVGNFRLVGNAKVILGRSSASCRGPKPASGHVPQPDLTNNVMDQNETSGELRVLQAGKHQFDPVFRQLRSATQPNFRMVDKPDVAFATESISHIKLGRSIDSSGQAPSLQIWEICLAGVMTESAENANEGFRVKPTAG
jgi:hypothetical protein